MAPDDNDIVYNSFGVDPLALFGKLFSWFQHSNATSGLYNLIVNIWEIYTVLAFLASALFIFGIVYSFIRFNQLAEIDKEKMLKAERDWKEKYGARAKDSQWMQIQAHISSQAPSDWKLAIIEADIMLEKVLNNAGYAGNTIAQKLKSASPTSFTTLQDAWDAHLIRNKIAHQGSDFVLTQRTAQEAITKFQRVFQEFDVL